MITRHYNRIPLVLMALLALLAAVWGGLLRMGWNLPPLRLSLSAAHGPLMVAGFLGTVIGIERAVALRQRWAYAVPLLTGLGGLLLIAGIGDWLSRLLITLGSITLLAIFIHMLRQHFTLFTAIMALGALTWVGGNLLWLTGQPIYQLVLWWIGFPVLTIAGERLELGRLIYLSRVVRGLFIVAIVVFSFGIAVSVFAAEPGARLAGLGMVGLSLWLVRYDIARRTVNKAGQPRYMAICLLSGYVWLGVAGFISVVYGHLTAGLRYDALLHALFVGFVFSMIFAHALIIIPAILGISVGFHRGYYLPLTLLHAGLLLRVAGDLAGQAAARQWGGLLNAIAFVIFLITIGYGIRQESRRAPPM